MISKRKAGTSTGIMPRRKAIPVSPYSARLRQFRRDVASVSRSTIRRVASLPLNTTISTSSTFTHPTPRMNCAAYTIESDGTLPFSITSRGGKNEARHLCRDLNVAHREIDLARPKQNRKNAGFSDEERAGFDDILSAGFVDTFRHFYPDKEDAYSWWSYRGGARAKNVGWRLDYFCVTGDFVENVKSSEILSDVIGSDHCPVRIELA